jgi:hypothetical protein
VLHGLRVEHGLVGQIAFDAGGDVTKPVATVFRARRGGASTLVSSTQGASRVRVVEVPRDLLR